MSARVGLIGDNALGGWHSYRASKNCTESIYVNMTKTALVELGKKNNIACILLHPGTVDTDLSRPFQRNVARDKLFTRKFSVQKLLSIINNAKKTDNGSSLLGMVKKFHGDQCFQCLQSFEVLMLQNLSLEDPT